MVQNFTKKVIFAEVDVILTGLIFYMASAVNRPAITLGEQFEVSVSSDCSKLTSEGAHLCFSISVILHKQIKCGSCSGFFTNLWSTRTRDPPPEDNLF